MVTFGLFSVLISCKSDILNFLHNPCFNIATDNGAIGRLVVVAHFCR